MPTIPISPIAVSTGTPVGTRYRVVPSSRPGVYCTVSPDPPASSASCAVISNVASSSRENGSRRYTQTRCGVPGLVTITRCMSAMSPSRSAQAMRTMTLRTFVELSVTSIGTPTHSPARGRFPTPKDWTLSWTSPVPRPGAAARAGAAGGETSSGLFSSTTGWPQASDAPARTPTSASQSAMTTRIPLTIGSVTP